MSDFKVVGTVTSLHVYPVKSCKVINLEEAKCIDTGIEFDRFWVLFDRGHICVTQRSQPKLALVKPSFVGDYLKLEAPDMPDLHLPLQPKDGEVVQLKVFALTGTGVHVSDEADGWFSKYLGKPGYKLYAKHPTGRPRTLKDDKEFGVTAKETDTTGFPDSTPYMLLSEESLSDLNEHFDDDKKMKMMNFRPNIVVAGSKAYEEDTWNVIRIGDTEFRGLYNCPRCTLPSVNPDTGIRGGREPLKTLQSYRQVPEDPKYGKDPIFGRNLATEKPGTIRIGDKVYASA